MWQKSTGFYRGNRTLSIKNKIGSNVPQSVTVRGRSPVHICLVVGESVTRNLSAMIPFIKCAAECEFHELDATAVPFDFNAKRFMPWDSDSRWGSPLDVYSVDSMRPRL
jgi:hypothetical protein